MSGKTIEDILVSGNYKKVEKKKNNTLIIIILSLLIILAAIAAVYICNNFIKNKEKTAKDFFLDAIVDNNLQSLMENKLYEETYEKVGNDTFYMDTSINFSTTFDIEGFENFDFSKFTVDNHLVRNADTKKVFTDSIIKYLDNDIFDLKSISLDNNFAINSDQIVTKYISGDTSKMNNLIKEVTGFDVNLNFGNAIIDDIKNSEKIEITEKQIESLNKNIKKIISGNLNEESVTSKDIIVESNGEQIQTTAYTAIIPKDDVLRILTKVKKEITDNKIEDRLFTDKNSVSIFDVKQRVNYTVDPNTDLSNIIDKSTFLVGEENIPESEVIEIVENIIPVEGTLNSTDVEDEDLEHRQGEIDETVYGYEEPVEQNPVQNQVSDPIVITPPIVDVNQNTTSNTTVNNNTNTNTNNTIKNTVNNGTAVNTNTVNNTTNKVSNTTSNTVANTTNNNVNTNSNTTINTTNTTNETILNTNTTTERPVSNETVPQNGITSDIVDDGTLIPLGLVESIEINSYKADMRRFSSDIQIIQNPNLTTEEDLRKQEENRELIKEETEELFTSITDAKESNVEIVKNSESQNKSEDFSVEYEILKAMLFKTKMNITIDEYNEFIESLYEKVQNYDFETLVISTYVADGRTVKIVISDNNNLQIEIDFIKINENENKLKVIFLKDNETRNGTMFEIYKAQRDVSCNYEISQSTIKEGAIVEKLVGTLTTKGTNLSNNIQNELQVQYLKGKEESFRITVDNSIGYEKKNIEELSDQNCLFLNTLSNEEYVAIVNAIKEKTVDVLAEKMTDLDLIDINTGNSFVNRVQEEAANNEQEENTISKDEARDIIINRVSELMGEAAGSGEEANLGILTNLRIEGYNVSSSVSQDEALIILNGHEFIIDSTFTIIDVN